MAQKKIQMFTRDYLVFEDEKLGRLSLAIVRDVDDEASAIAHFNSKVRIARGKKKQPKATHAVRIRTAEGTLARLSEIGWKPKVAQ
jgi:hypothetical protein